MAFQDTQRYFTKTVENTLQIHKKDSINHIKSSSEQVSFD